MKQYKAAKGALFGDEKAQLYGEAIADLIQKYGDITPEIYVSEAKSCVLKDTLTWNNKRAAEAYRLQQARNVINHINVVVMKNGEEVEYRAFHSTTVIVGETETENKVVRIYQATETILNSDQKHILLNQIIQKFVDLREKYKPYRELDPIFKAIDAVSKDK